MLRGMQDMHFFAEVLPLLSQLMSDKNYHSLGLFLCVHVRVHVCHGEGGEGFA